MELLWQNGQVVVQSQTQMSLKKSPHHKNVDHQSSQITREIRPEHDHSQNHDQNRLFIQEDEMASWLHYPINDTNFDQPYLCADLLYPSAACVTSSTTATNTSATPLRSVHNPEPRPHPAVPAPRPPIPPTRRAEVVQNFTYFSGHRARGSGESSEPSNFYKPVVRESTVVDSSVTPAAIGSESRISEAEVGRSGSVGDNACRTISGGAAGAGTSSRAGGSNNNHNNSREMMTCDMTVNSSPGRSTSSAEAGQKPQTEDRKRKGREEETEYHGEVSA